MKKANKTNDLSIISFTMKGIISSDKLFTIPGVIIITIGGFSAAIIRRSSFVKNGMNILVTSFIYFFRTCLFLETGTSAKKNLSAHCKCRKG